MVTSGFSHAWAALYGPFRSIDHARKVARIACGLVAFRAIYTTIMFILFRPTREQVIAQLQRVRGPVTLDDAGVDQQIFDRIADVFTFISGVITALIVLFCLAIGIWQWKRPGPTMPLICLGIITVTTLFTLTAMQDPGTFAVVMKPQNLVLLLYKPVLAVLMFAAYRGGQYCHQHRMGQL